MRRYGGGWGILLVLGAVAFGGCGGGSNVDPTFDGAPAAPDARTPVADFDHFEFEVSPTIPLQDKLFDVEVTAYSSVDDSERHSTYDGTVTLASSVGTLTGDAAGQELNNGKVMFQISLDTAAPDVVLTIVDDDYAEISGTSAPFFVSAPGDTATALDVVISEANWFGNVVASTDEWVEIRNVSGSELNLSEWTLDRAGSSGSPVLQFDNGTSLADGDYLVVARQQGPDVDGERTSLTGVAGVQLHTMELGNAGEALVLRDVAGTTIDETPTGGWPAGDNDNDFTMERRDDVTGGGYTDGTEATAWYTWSSLDVVQTTSEDSTDQGTPGANNSDPDLFNHFTFEIQPASPKANIDFTVTLTAYTSDDDTLVTSGYNGLVSLSASAGALSGEISSQPMVNGVATLTLQNNQIGTGVTITAVDSLYSNIVGTSGAFDVLPEGDLALLRQVVISEVNYFGNDGASADEWIEIRNISGGSLNLADWTLEAAGTGAEAITIDSATFLADGEYLVLADRRGPDMDTLRTSLTGVAGVQIQPLSLGNGGEHLVLRDIENTLIDETPDPGWPAGDTAVQFSMERRDDIVGGGYSDGALDGAWYTWSSIDGVDTTNADSTDSGTPGTDNSNPDLFDHFTFVVTPASPIIGTDFTLEVQAFSSTDESVPLAGYNGTISVTEAVTGSLSGDAVDQPISGGVASLTLQFDSNAPVIALSVADAVYPDIIGTTADFAILDTGDDADLLDVVISEVNWFGNDASSSDEWVELRNVSGATLDLSGWTIDGLGSGANAVTIASNTFLVSGAYLVVADRQGADVDGERTSLTGVVNVQVRTGVALANGGDPLTLRDIDGTIIDETPAGAFPAGSSASDRSMERRDNISGGGYTDGSDAGAWYTWNVFDNNDSTNADSSDQGTPGADNSDPDAFSPPLALPYATSFETAEPVFENLSTGGFSNTPPAGTTALTGTAVATTGTITTAFTGRQLQGFDCLTLVDDTTTVNASANATASTDNGGNGLAVRIKLLWFMDASCTTPNATVSNSGSGQVLVEGAYSAASITIVPPAGATHAKIRVEVRDDNGGTNTGDDYAIDDVSVSQP